MINKKHLLAIGGSGLVGSRILELLKDDFMIRNYSLETGVNITDPSTLFSLLDAPEGSIVFHLAAKADVDACEKDKDLGEDGPAWKINVLGAKNVAEICLKRKHTMIYVSTDFVFSGDDTPEGGYTEEDAPHPKGWYAITKYEGEKRVIESGIESVIMRISYPYRKAFPEKLDFVRAIAKRMRDGLEIQAVTDHIMTPTFIDDIAFALRALIENEAKGIYHVVGSSSLTPFDATGAIAEAFGIPNSVIEKTTREVFFHDRAPRPFNLTMKNDKISELGVKMKTFKEGLHEIASNT